MGFVFKRAHTEGTDAYTSALDLVGAIQEAYGWTDTTVEALSVQRFYEVVHVVLRSQKESRLQQLRTNAHLGWQVYNLVASAPQGGTKLDYLQYMQTIGIWSGKVTTPRKVRDAPTTPPVKRSAPGDRTKAEETERRIIEMHTAGKMVRTKTL